MASLLRGIGITDLPPYLMAAAFGNGACNHHITEQVKRMAFQEGLEIRQEREKLKVVGHKQPVKHFPADYQSRVRRLAELEAEMRRPSRVKAALDQLEAKVKRINRLADEAARARMQAAQRVQLYQYLKSQGYDDPARLFNL